MDRLDAILGTGSETLTIAQTGIRAVLAFLVLVALLRLGSKRLMGRGSAFDMVVAIMIGSVMASSITRSHPVLRIYLAVAVLIGLHAALSWMAARIGWFGPLFKGHRVRLVKDGTLRRDAMVGSGITDSDLKAALRGDGSPPDLNLIGDAWLERDGSISLLTSAGEARVVAVEVHEGVQTVRVEMR